MFDKLGRLATGKPWWVIAFWLVAIAVLVPLSPGLKTSSGGTADLPGHYESVRADAAARSAFPERGGQTAVFVVQRKDGGVLQTGDLAVANRLAAAVDAARIDSVTAATYDAAALLRDKTVLPIQVGLASKTGTDQSAAERVTKDLREVAGRTVAGTGVTAALTGGPALTADTGDAISKAEVTLSIGTILALLLLLALIFRSPVTVLMPLLSVGLVYLGAHALIGLISDAVGFEVGSFAPALLVVILFGVGVDYTLFLLFRYRELIRRGNASTPSVAHAVRSVGEAISSSALVVIAAFVALSFSEIKSSAALAPTLIISLAVMLLAGLTLIPAVMTVLGERLFWLNRSWRRRPSDTCPSASLGAFLANRPGRALGAGALLIALLGIATIGTTIDYDPNAGLPSSYASVKALTTFNNAFPAGALNPTQVYAPAGTTAVQLRELRAALGRQPGVASVLPTQRAASGTIETDVILTAAPYSSAALDTVRDHVRPVAHRVLGRDALVGGQTAVTLDTRTATLRDLRVVYLIAALLIALILGAVLRSLVAPILVLLMVGLAFIGALGSSVLVVQHLHGDAGVSSSIPLLLFLLVVALGSDYTIIMAARVREELRHSRNQQAVAAAARHTTPTVAAAGAVLAATFATLIITGVPVLSQIGLAVVTGILLVAFLVACWLLPAVISVTGTLFWWPGHPARDTPPQRTGSEQASSRQLRG